MNRSSWIVIYLDRRFSRDLLLDFFFRSLDLDRFRDFEVLRDRDFFFVSSVATTSAAAAGFSTSLCSGFSDPFSSTVSSLFSWFFSSFFSSLSFFRSLEDDLFRFSRDLDLDFFARFLSRDLDLLRLSLDLDLLRSLDLDLLFRSLDLSDQINKNFVCCYSCYNKLWLYLEQDLLRFSAFQRNLH